MSAASEEGLLHFAVSAAMIGYFFQSWTKTSSRLKKITSENSPTVLILLNFPASSWLKFRNEFVVNSILSKNHFQKCFIRVENAIDAPIPRWLSYASDLYSITWNHAIKEGQDFATDFIVVPDTNDLTFFAKKEKISLLFSEPNRSLGPLAGLDFADFPSTKAIDAGFSENSVVFMEDLLIDSTAFSTFHHVAVGGSFDHLHNGHRKLLCVASLLSQQRLTVGISGNSLLNRKDFVEYIETFPHRENRVKEFLLSMKSDLQLNIVKIEDPFGPTITDPSIQAIVVSSETLLGGFHINSIRSEKGWNRLVIVVVRRSEGNMMSSTFLRKLQFPKIK